MFTQCFCALATKSRWSVPISLSFRIEPCLGVIGNETTKSVPLADHTESSTMLGLVLAINCATSESLFSWMFLMYCSECSAWIPLAVPRSTEALPEGLTQVVRAAALIPSNSATLLLVSLTISAPFSRILPSKRISGLFIHPVIDTPRSASRSKIAFVVSGKYVKSVYPACSVPRIAPASHAL